MRRREFIGLMSSAASWPLIARAQQLDQMRRIGILVSLGADDRQGQTRQAAFIQSLKELGWTEGRNVRIETRWAAGNTANMYKYAAELIAFAPDVILAAGGTVVGPLLQATKTVPIVFTGISDPVGGGLVASLARPGGNVTGTTFLGPELVAKRLQLLRDVVPGLTRVAALLHPHAYGEQTMASVVKDTEDAARTLGMQLQLAPADSPDEIAAAFSVMMKAGAGAFIVLPSPMLFGQHRQIVELAVSNRLPGMYQAREFVDAGGLMSYGANLDDLFRRTATYVDKILKGAKPADLPVERPTKFELVINVKAARDAGLTINRDILLVADEVIE